MKNIFICLCFLLYISLEAQAQINENMNYITTRVTDKNNTESGLTDIVYYDGLGREKESIRLGISPNGDDLYTHIVYDGLGNKVLESIPTPSSKNGAFVPFDYTANSDSGYIRNEYMRALNLPIKQTGPGAAWFLNSAGISYEYSGNCKYPVADYVISSTGRLERKGVFPANSLKCNTVWDEDKNKVETFTDNIGRVILTRRYDSSKAYDTYNVYDSRNRLCYIFPPMASDALITNREYAMEKGGVLDLYAYYYQYDSYNRCVEKKLPGVEPIYYVYDKADRLVLSQSGNQRKKKQWLFHKYDFGGREIIMGILTTDKTVSFLTSYLNNKIVIETYTHNETSGSFGYTNNFSFSDDMEIITAHYYDTYDFISLSSFRNSTHSNTFLNYVHDNSYGIHYPNSKGLQTGVFVRQFDAPSRGEITAYYYDKAGQPVQIRSYYTPEGHSNVISSLYNYRGDLLRMQKKHTSGFYRYPYPPSDPRMLNDQKEEYEYEYDHAYRPVRLYHCHNDGERILLLENKYDELGRLQEKYRHNHTDTVAYTYNSRNWLTSIKSRNFTEHIYYNDSNTPAQYRRYNGNIGHINYVQGRPQSYKFQYDGLNRLVGVTTTGSSIIHYESYEYDKMGNITFLEHSQNDGNILNRLTMTYSGNQLQTATNEADFDPSYSELNYPDNSHADKEFFYDANGNLTKNLNKEIVAIRYNILNLPDTIQFGNGNQIINSYLADGRKIKTIYKTYTTNIVVPQDIIWKSDDPCEISTDQWDGSYMYRSRTVKNGYVNHEMYMIQIPEGFISADHLGSDEERYYLYNYYVHDHLGNVRLSKSVESNVIALQSLLYSPTGILLGNSKNVERQPFMFGGKEFIGMHGLNEYDFNARMYDPWLMRTQTMDPMAEKYAWISPYAFCNNNTARYTDPTGMIFTDRAWGKVKYFLSDISKRIARNAAGIEKATALINGGGLSDKEIRKLQRKINRLTDNNTELEAARGEIAILKASDQTYDIHTDNFTSTNESAIGGAGFNFKNNNFEIKLPSTGGLSMLAHELKHAYQFEIGELSTGEFKDGQPYYDQSDEVAAYARGALFGGIPRSVFSIAEDEIYGRLQKGPMDVTKEPEIKINSPKMLQNMANVTHSAFRVNGVTYIRIK